MSDLCLFSYGSVATELAAKLASVFSFSFAVYQAGFCCCWCHQTTLHGPPTCACMCVWGSLCPFPPPAPKWTSRWVGMGGRRCLALASPDGLSSPCTACEITSSNKKKRGGGGGVQSSKQQPTSAPVKCKRARDEERQRERERASERTSPSGRERLDGRAAVFSNLFDSGETVKENIAE